MRGGEIQVNRSSISFCLKFQQRIGRKKKKKKPQKTMFNAFYFRFHCITCFFCKEIKWINVFSLIIIERIFCSILTWTNVFLFFLFSNVEKKHNEITFVFFTDVPLICSVLTCAHSRVQLHQCLSSKIKQRWRTAPFLSSLSLSHLTFSLFLIFFV